MNKIGLKKAIDVHKEICRLQELDHQERQAEGIPTEKWLNWFHVSGFMSQAGDDRYDTETEAKKVADMCLSVAKSHPYILINTKLGLIRAGQIISAWQLPAKDE